MKNRQKNVIGANVKEEKKKAHPFCIFSYSKVIKLTNTQIQMCIYVYSPKHEIRPSWHECSRVCVWVIYTSLVGSTVYDYYFDKTQVPSHAILYIYPFLFLEFKKDARAFFFLSLGLRWFLTLRVGVLYQLLFSLILCLTLSFEFNETSG